MHTAQTYDVFLSYHWRDRDAVERIARSLRDLGLNPFLDRWYLVPGMPWPQALEQVLVSCRAVAVCIGPGEMGPWQKREAYSALDRQGRVPGLPVIPILLPGSDPVLGFLGQNTWVDLRQESDDPLCIALLAGAIRGEPPGPDLAQQVLAVCSLLCPYRGLLYFREEDAPFFFGRDAAIANLFEAVQRRQFFAVVGASGCGKSSVVRAGLVPKLRQDSQTIWEAVTFFPEDDPLKSLAKAMILLLEPEITGETERLLKVNKLAHALAKKELSLHDVARRALEKQPGTDRLLLVVDQAEELFTLTKDDQICRRFIDEILDASERGSLTAVLTLRGDFVGKALSYRPLSDRLQGSQINVGPMTRAELELAITAPAKQVGLTFVSGLVSRILNDVGDEPGNLPLLEFVLKRLWEDRQGPQLSHESYDAIGRLEGAVAKKAEEVFTNLQPLEQEAVKRVFLQVVRPGESGDDTRRRAPFSEIGEAALDVVKKLADKRLLVTSHGDGGEDTVEVSHEALIRHWGRLQGWLKEDRVFLLWRERLRARVEEWQRSDKDEATLLRGPLLVEAQRWISQKGEGLTENERRYIKLSAEASERVMQEEQERMEHELTQAKRLAEEAAKREEAERARADEQSRRMADQKKAARRLLGGLVVLLLALVAAIAMWYEARQMRLQAQQARQKAEELVSFMLFDLRDKLEPVGRLDILDDVNARVNAYYKSLGTDGAEEYLRGQAVAFSNHGDVLIGQGWLAEALQAYEASRDIVTRLASQDATNTQWQRDLSVSHEGVGNVLVAQGKLGEALQAYEAYREIATRLNSQDPTNTQWQRDLSISHNKVGNVLVAQGKLGEALSAYEASREVRTRLLGQDPTNTQWQRDLSVSHDRVGDVLVAQGKLGEALSAYEAGREIATRLAGHDPTNAIWQSDLKWVQDRIASLQKRGTQHNEKTGDRSRRKSRQRP